MDWTIEMDQSRGSLVVSNLKGEDGEPTLLICIYPEGDCDTPKEDGKILCSALYDLYQVDDRIKDGDTFLMYGKVLYRSSGAHVVREKSQPHLTKAQKLPGS